MKIAIFGATGGTGLQLLAQGLALGLRFRALVRNPSHQDLLKTLSEEERNKVDWIQGDALKKEDVEKTVADQEVVVVTLGSRPGAQGPADLCSRAQKLINDAILQTPSVRRLILVSSMGVGDSYADLGFLTRFFVNTVIKKPIEDKTIQEESVRLAFPKASSSVDWIILRPGGLTNGQVTEKVRAQERGIAGGRIARADVAWFIWKKCLQGDDFSRKSVVLVQS